MCDVLKYMTELQPHIKLKKGDIAPYVLIPGDPGRVRTIASYWQEAKEIMFNREFLTMTGVYNGVPISAVSTGIGCPSAAIAVEELANIGAKVLIRVGTCGALREEIKVGDLIIPNRALRQDGTTKEYVDSKKQAIPDDDVYNKLIQAAEKLDYRYFTGVNRTHDAFYEPIDNFLNLQKLPEYEQGDLISSEMECSAVFLVGGFRSIKTGAVLAVNTEEPLNLIAKNPEMIYHLETAGDGISGISRAIRTALLAVELMADNSES